MPNMFSKRKLFLIVAIFINIHTHSQNIGITWNLGSLDFVWNHLEQVSNDEWNIQKSSVSLLDFQYHDRENIGGIQLSALKLRNDYDLKSIFSFLPTEIWINIIKGEFSDICLFGKSDIEFRNNKIYVAYEYGIKAAIFVLNDPNKIAYSWRNSIYISFDEKNEFNIGTTIDIGLIGLLILATNKNNDSNSE